MRRFRLLQLGVLLLAVTTTGCVSGNKGKIEGTKWVSETASVHGQALPPGALTLTFNADGTLNGWIGHEPVSGKYTLGWGDSVTLHLDKALRNGKIHSEKVVIEGDRMTMTDPDGTQMAFRKKG